MALGLLFLALALFAQCSEAKKPHIVWFVMDDVGWFVACFFFFFFFFFCSLAFLKLGLMSVYATVPMTFKLHSLTLWQRLEW